MKKLFLLSFVLVAALLGALIWKGFSGSPKPGEKVLLGGLTEKQVLQALPSWKQAYDAYRPDSAAVAVIKSVKKPVEILVFLGTWCPDSKREVPRLMKALDQAGNPKIRVKYYGVPHGFRENDDTAAQYRIKAVPTFIVRVGAKEIGRIVERAELGIEQDLAQILRTANLEK